MSKTRITLGPPGTGKTTYLVNQVKTFIEDGFSPKDIGYFSFTKAAAVEATSRVTENLKGMEVSTLHSLAFRNTGIIKEQVIDDEKLKEFSEIVGYGVRSRALGGEDFEEFEKGEQLLILYQLEQNVGSRTRAHDEHPELEYNYFKECYEQWKDTNGFMDFGDMLRVFAEDLESGKSQCKFEILIVDEAQDLSNAQLRILRVLKSRCQIMLIGADDDQSLFEWAGANTLGFAALTNTPHVVLDQSYRVPRSVHRVAQQIVSSIQNRLNKRYLPRDAEGSVTYESSMDNVLVPRAVDVLCLYRNHTLRHEVLAALHDQRVPYSMINGYGSWFTGRQAQALRSWMKIQKGEPISRKGIEVLANVVNERWMRDALLSNSSQEFLNIRNGLRHWRRFIKMPDDMANYLDAICTGDEFFAQPKVRVGTIHSSKGMEAHTVILLNGMGHKTQQEMTDAEYRVWYVGVTRAKENLIIVDHDNPLPELAS